MTKRKVIITDNSNLADPHLLPRHSCVKKHWPLLAGYTLFEFSHPAFQLTRESRFATSKWDYATQNLASAAVNEERELLKPLYASLLNPSDAVMLFIPSENATYEFVGRDKWSMRWPDLGCSPHWEVFNELRIAGRLVPSSKGLSQQHVRLRRLFTDWAESLRHLQTTIEHSEVKLTGTYFATEIKCSDPAGDASMVLYLLATLQRSQIGLESIGFFERDDFETPFLEIGGARTTEQIHV